MAESAQPEPQRRKKQTHWAEHPLAVWAIENLSVVGLCVVRERVLWKPNRSDLLWNSIRNIVGGFWTTEGSLLLQYAFITRLYKHIPYFCKDQAKLPRSYTSLSAAFKDWLGCNFLVYTSVSVFAAWLDSKLPPAVWDSLAKHPFRLFEFLKKLAIMRVVVDVIFYIVHRLLHTKWLYAAVHKRHHQHVRTALTTNYCFTQADLILEVRTRTGTRGNGLDALMMMMGMVVMTTMTRRRTALIMATMMTALTMVMAELLAGLPEVVLRS
jgi:hypothetical protein